MKRHFFTLLVLLFNLSLLSSAAFPQSASGQPSNRETLRFTAIVLDAHGVPVRDLQKDDFTVTVAGMDRSTEVHTPQTADPSTIGNRGLIVVVIDAMHTAWLEEKDLRLNAGKYVAACAKRDVPVSLLLFSRQGVFIPVHEFTTGSAILTAALEQADAMMRHQASASPSPEIAAEAQRLFDFYRGEGKFATRQAMEQYPGAILGGVKEVAQSVAAIPGRKSLIWVSSTYPFAVEEKKGKILSPTNRYITAGNLIYPNLLTEDQVRQLQVIWEDTIGSAQASALALYPVQTRITATVPLNPEVINSMTSMAHMTGGAEVHSVGDFFPQFLELGDQSRAAYQVDVPADVLNDCKSDWCPMKISVKRAGTRVLAPQGFFRNTRMPGKPAVASQPAETEAAPNTIPFTVTWEPAENKGAKKKVAFTVAFAPAAGIPTAGSADLNLEVMVHAFAGGADKQSVSFGANTHLPQATLDEVHTQGFVLNNAIELEPGEYSVRFVVHDKVSGRVGVLSVPLKVG